MPCSRHPCNTIDIRFR